MAGDDDSICPSTRRFALDARDFFIDYRLALLLAGLTIINILIYRSLQFLTRFAMYQHLTDEVRLELAMRCIQLLFGAFLTLAYPTLVVLATGCDVTELYLYYVGAWLAVIDLHEYVRRWPLRRALLAHHVTTLGIAISFTDLGILPAGGEIDPVTILFLGNLGVCWMTDFFHAVFRLSKNLRIIKRFQRVYLRMNVLRIVNIGLLVAQAVRAGLRGSTGGCAFTVFMVCSYSYNTVKATRFVMRFSVERYFEKHQVKFGIVSGSNNGADAIWIGDKADASGRPDLPPTQRRSSILVKANDMLGLAPATARGTVHTHGAVAINYEADEDLTEHRPGHES